MGCWVAGGWIARGWVAGGWVARGWIARGWGWASGYGLLEAVGWERGLEGLLVRGYQILVEWGSGLDIIQRAEGIANVNKVIIIYRKMAYRLNV